MQHSGSLPDRPLPRTKSGRPVRPTILALEGHVEEIVALTDDAALLRRSAVAEWHLLVHIEEAHREERIADFNRATSAVRRLIRERLDRAQRLIDVVIPEVTACYAALEASA
jgi:hypothetical protein